MSFRLPPSGSSSSLLPNLSANRMQVNRLQANDLKVSNLKEENSQMSLLFSLQLKNGNWTGSQLIFNKNEVDLITFSDRPFRYQKHNTDSEATEILEQLFTEDGPDSFTEDPPNAVLSTKNGQEVFIIKSLSVSNNVVTMNLTALKNQDILIPTKGAMSLFIDSGPCPYVDAYWDNCFN